MGWVGFWSFIWGLAFFLGCFAIFVGLGFVIVCVLAVFPLAGEFCFDDLALCLGPLQHGLFGFGHLGL